MCDGVGLGKTFVGLMLIERLILHEGKRVVLFAPKATKEGVYYGQCSELCGKNHAFMPIAVRVVSESDFNRWLDEAKKKYAHSDDSAPMAFAAKESRETQ